jgi:hypothetical protein
MDYGLALFHPNFLKDMRRTFACLQEDTSKPGHRQAGVWGVGEVRICE